MTPSHQHLPAEPKRDRIIQLDALRGVAAIWVMLYHYTIQYAGDFGHGPGAWRVPQGQRAVELFFMISGFVIPMTLGRTRRAEDFIVSRFSRLYPTFWVCLALTFAVTALTHWRGAEASGWDAAANTTMVPQLVFHRPYVDHSYWTLEVELLFYVISFLAWRIGGMRGVAAAIAGLCALALAEGITLPKNVSGWRGVFDSFLLMAFIAYFACGFALYQAREHGLSAATIAMLALALATVAVRNGWENLLTTLLLTGAMMLASFNRFPGLSARPLLLIGTISYPLYLLHQNIGYILIQYGYAKGLSANLNILFACASSLLLGATVSICVERPAMQWIRGLYRQRRGDYSR